MKSITVPQDWLKELIGEVLPESVSFLEKKYGFEACAAMGFDPEEPSDYPPGSTGAEGDEQDFYAQIHEHILTARAIMEETLRLQSELLQNERLMTGCERADTLGDKVALFQKARTNGYLIKAFEGGFVSELHGFDIDM